MARIAGIDIPRDKRIVISLTDIYGVGKTTAQEILNTADVSEDTVVRDLTEGELGRIRQAVAEYTIEGDLRREKSLNVQRLIDIGSYRGMRHRQNLPVRGQKTKNNARTRKGPRHSIN